MKEKKNNQWFHDILNEGLETFAAYWEYDRIEKTWKTEGVCRNNDIWVKKDVERLKEAIAYDASGVTAYMLLRAYLHRLLQNATFSAFDLIINWETEKVYLEKFSSMRASLEKPEALAVLADYEERLKQMAASYETESAAGVAEVVASPIDLAFLRFSAYQSLEKKLKAHQFVQGDGTKEKLKVHSKVYECCNMNSLIAAAARQAFDGVALCAVRDPAHFFASFFVIAVKAGETLTILTDRFKGAHPKYHEMSRRPDRDFDARGDENWFPYQLFETEVSEDGKQLFEKRRDQLVPFQSELIPLADIGSLQPPQILWLGILLNLIAEKFGGEKPLQLPALSYTADMIRQPDALVPPESSLIVAGKYQPLNLPPITHEDLEPEKIADNFEKPAIGFNRHVAERFKDQVPEALFNVIGTGEARLLREGADETLSRKKKPYWHSDKAEFTTEIRNLSPLDFGTPEEINKDRLWTARYNQISYIRDLAKREFEQNKDEVIAAYQAKVRANEKNLLYAVAALECEVESGLWISRIYGDEDYNGFPRRDRKKHKIENILNITTWKGNRSGLWVYSREQGAVLFGYYNEKCPPYYYCLSDEATAANVAGIFQPTEAAHLAVLADCEVSDLPDQLQNWTTEKPYSGNHILERLDPEDWHLTDFYRDLKFPIIFALSKRYMNQLRKDYGFLRIEWAAYEEKK